MSERENLQIARRVFEARNARDPNRYAALLEVFSRDLRRCLDTKVLR
jgi:hypothetical protein